MADKAGIGGAAAATMGEAAGKAAETAQGTAETMREGFQEHVVDPARRAGEAMKASGERLAASGSSIGTRMIDQAEANAHEAFAAMRAAAGAKDIAEVMRIQGDYLREQSQRSMAQAREVGEMIAQFGREALGTLRGEAIQPPRS